MSDTVSTAMVLAAGLGKRMRPLTDDIPKPLVRLAGAPLIDHVLDRLAAADVKRAVVNAHYKADKLTAHLARRTKPEIILSDERGVLLDTGGAVVRALPKLGPAPFFILNSDSVWIESAATSQNSNLQSMIAAWDSARMDFLMLLADANTSLGYSGAGDFSMATDGRLQRRADGATAPFVFAGVSITHPRLFEGLEEQPFSLNRLWDQAIARDRLFGQRLDGIWMHVGTPDALQEAEALIADNRSDVS